MAFPIQNLLSENMSNMLITLVIPFLIIFGVLLFALKKTKILGDSNFIYILISLGLTVMIYAVRPDVFNFLAFYLVQIGVAGAIIALGGVTIMIFFSLIRGGKNIADKLKGDEQHLKDLRKEREKLMEKYNSRGFFGIGGAGVGKREEILRRMEQFEREERLLMAKMRKQVH